MNMRRIVQIAKTVVTVAALASAPMMFMAQPAPFEVGADSGATYAPEWTAELAERFPACDAHEAGDLTAAVVVVLQSGEVRRMSTNNAYSINTDDNRANDLWVVGACGK